MAKRGHRSSPRTPQPFSSRRPDKKVSGGLFAGRDQRLIIGDHAIREVVAMRPRTIEAAYLQEGWERSQDLRELEKKLQSAGVRVETRPSGALDAVGTHQGAVLRAFLPPELDLEPVAKKDRAILLALDGLEDPHNLGAILRTAWLMGASGALLSQDRTVGLTPAVHKVAAGGVEHVPLLRVSQFQPSFDKMREKGFWVFGLSHRASKTIFDLKLPEKLIWVLGAEGRGLRGTTEKACDELVRLPQIQAEASYNVSVAAAMALAESWRQLKL